MAFKSEHAGVYFQESRAGTLSRKERGSVSFTYDKTYVAQGGPPLSLSLPLRCEPFTADGLPAYFSGLCSEGWLRRTQSFQQGIHPDDDFTRLVLNGGDLAGAVTIFPEKDDYL